MTKGFTTVGLVAISSLVLISCGASSVGGPGQSSNLHCTSNCTLQGTWSANLNVSCASTIGACSPGTVLAQGTLPTIALPTRYGVLSNAPGTGNAGAVTIYVSNAAGPIYFHNSTCSPNTVAVGVNGNAEAAQITLYQGGPSSCSFSLNGTVDQNGTYYENGQTIDVAYTGPY